MNKLPVPTEHAEQSHVVQWFWLQYPALRKCLFAIPNGAHLAGTIGQRAAKMNKMKSEGFQAGVSDLFLMVARGSYHGLWIEMKRKNARPSDVSEDQVEFLERAAREGYKGIVCNGAKPAIEAISEYLKLEQRMAA
jgi:hypothetical protein